MPTTGHAYTDEEQQACQPDAFRLCSSEIPDVDRVTACMVARKSELSPECRRFFRSDPEPAAAAPAGRHADEHQACDGPKARAEGQAQRH